MEPPRVFGHSIWNFICFLLFFIALLNLGFIKVIIMFPVIFLIITTGISGTILVLWPLHIVYTYYCILSTKQFGPALKLILFPLIAVLFISWPPVGIMCGVLGGAGYGMMAPFFATFRAVDEGKTEKFYHCIFDGTWSSVKGSFTIIRDFLDVCYFSYFSIMDDLWYQGPPDGNYYEISLLRVPVALIAGILGSIIDLPVISVLAVCKSPYMLFKGWVRLFHDCIGREGPFLESICIPFAGLAILLWPLAVVGAVLASILSSIFIGAYAAIITYQENSLWFGLCYIAASLSLYDEYSNDVIDMPEGSCFPRPKYRTETLLQTSSDTTSIASADLRKTPHANSISVDSRRLDLKPHELIDGLFKECQRYGAFLALKGIITRQDIEDSMRNKHSSSVISIGLPTYCLLQMLLRSIKANSTGLLLADNVTEITSSNRPKDACYDWFLNPIWIIKDQIKAANLSEPEEEYFSNLVILSSKPDRLDNPNIGAVPESELRRAELDALARRLQGIMKSISRYPTVRRRFEISTKNMLKQLGKDGDSQKTSNGDPKAASRSKSMFVQVFSGKSLKSRTNSSSSVQETQTGADDERDVGII